jgi:hypothetical protein
VYRRPPTAIRRARRRALKRFAASDSARRR